MRKVLIVEDSPVMRGMLETLVDTLGDIEVEAVENGLEALRVLPTVEFSLIITDINMPNINGLELISFIRQSPKHQDTPIIVVSTESAEKDRNKGMSLGASAYLTKPFNESELINLVTSLLGGAE
jgi:two-component system chemotaxis response regulator CheY